MRCSFRPLMAQPANWMLAAAIPHEAALNAELRPGLHCTQVHSSCCKLMCCPLWPIRQVHLQVLLLDWFPPPWSFEGQKSPWHYMFMPIFCEIPSHACSAFP